MTLPARPWLLFFAMLAVFALVDFRLRVLVSRTDTVRPMTPPALKAPTMGEPVAVIVQRLSGWLPVDIQSAKTGPSADDWLLEAVFVRGGLSRAILALKGPDGQITRRVRAGVGEEIEGWRLEGIEPRKVVLSRDGAPLEIKLFKRAATDGGGG